MTRDELINFYRNTEYKKISLSIRGIPPRPSEWNIPQIIKTIFEHDETLFLSRMNEDKIYLQLAGEDLEYFKAILLHESIFHFYKSFIIIYVL